MAELAPGQVLDQFEIQEIVARSGMATIFRARDTESGRIVALKVPHLQYAGDIVFHQRFLREEQIGIRLDHPSVVKVFLPRQRTRLYLVMEYVEGTLLRERLSAAGRLSAAESTEIALQLADTLAYLHAQGVVHRDLKPENIVLLAKGGIKLMDFGIALDTAMNRITWGGLSQPMGTPQYMAPEQIMGERGDGRTDIYGLGMILYEMLTGAAPFPSHNVYAAMRAKIFEPPVPPRKVRPEISPGMEEIILRAIDRDPRERYATAEEIREALKHPEQVTPTERAARRPGKTRLGVWWWKVRARLLGLTQVAE